MTDVGLGLLLAIILISLTAGLGVLLVVIIPLAGICLGWTIWDRRFAAGHRRSAGARRH